MNEPISINEWVERLYNVRMEPDKLLIMIENKRAELRRAPAPAQSREEEAQAWALLEDTLKDYELMRDASRGRKALAALAVLRSRQSPQAVDATSCNGCEHSYEGHYIDAPDSACLSCIDRSKRKAAAPQPSPQGEDAKDDALLRGIDDALRAYNELRRDDPFKLTSRECIFADLLSQARARLASAQSSAQGEEAREIREPVRWFAERMEEKLKANDYKGGWKGCTREYLLSRLRGEVHELAAFDNIVDEAADVANFAMMIADNARSGALKRKEGAKHPPTV